MTLDPDRYRAIPLHRQLDESQAGQDLLQLFKGPERIALDISHGDAWQLAAAVQMATRNPSWQGPTRDNVERIAREILAAIATTPQLQQLAEMGWDPAHDRRDADARLLAGAIGDAVDAAVVDRELQAHRRFAKKIRAIDPCSSVGILDAGDRRRASIQQVREAVEQLQQDLASSRGEDAAAIDTTANCTRTACRRRGAVFPHAFDRGRNYCFVCAMLINSQPGQAGLVRIPPTLQSIDAAEWIQAAAAMIKPDRAKLLTAQDLAAQVAAHSTTSTRSTPAIFQDARAMLAGGCDPRDLLRRLQDLEAHRSTARPRGNLTR